MSRNSEAAKVDSLSRIAKSLEIIAEAMGGGATIEGKPFSASASKQAKPPTSTGSDKSSPKK